VYHVRVPALMKNPRLRFVLRAPVMGLLWGLMVGGCAHAPMVGGARVLSWEQGRGARVLAAPPRGVEDPETTLDVWSRELSVLPLRLQPWTEDEAALGRGLAAAQQVEAGVAGDLDLLALDERSPWLLETSWSEEERRLRVLIRHAGEQRPDWSWEGKAKPERRLEKLRSVLSKALYSEAPEAGEEGDGWPLMASKAQLRQAFTAFEQGAPSFQQGLQDLGKLYPRDPALLELQALDAWVGGAREDAVRLMRRAQLLNPHAESSLVGWIRQAGGATTPIGVAIAELLAEVWPARPEYLLFLSEALESEGQLREAQDLVLAGLSRIGRTSDSLVPEGEGLAGEHPIAVVTADLRFNLAWLLYQRGKINKSIPVYSSALDLYQSLNMQVAAAETRNDLGVSLVDEGKPLSGIHQLEAALKVQDSLGYRGQAAQARFNLGMAYSQMGRVAESLRSFDVAAEDYAAVGDERAAIECLIASLDPAAVGGQWERVRAAVELLESGGIVPRDLQALMWLAVSDAYTGAGRVEDAMVGFERSYKLWAELGRRDQMGRVHYDRAIAYMSLGRISEAVGELKLARALAAEVDDLSSVYVIDQQLARIRSLFTGDE